MGKTIYEKILARASGQKEVNPGDILWVKPDLIAVTDVDWAGRMRFFEKVGLERLPKPEKIVAVVDHCVEQAIAPESAENNKSFREWAKKNGVVNFYDVGRGGLAVQVLMDKAHVRPGMMAIHDDPEGEACGAVGAFVKGGEDVWTAMAIDEWWFEVPRIVRCEMTGRFHKGVTSTDLRYMLFAKFGTGFEKFIEFTGSAIHDMGIDERVNLCSALYLIGSNGIIGADGKTIEYMRQRTGEPFDVVKSDSDAEYAENHAYDVASLEPQIAYPPSATNVRPVADAEGIEIHEACVGTCANGRLPDLRVSAQILKNRKLAGGVRMYITPVSQEVYLAALKEGLITVFVEAGAVVTFPSCGTCPGHIGRLAAGEVCISTGIVNYPGRMGSKDADIYLASAATVTASAVRGRITDPREFL